MGENAEVGGSLPPVGDLSDVLAPVWLAVSSGQRKNSLNWVEFDRPCGVLARRGSVERKQLR